MGLTRIRAEQVANSDFKQACRTITTANIANFSGGAPLVIDGVTLLNGNRVIVNAQSDATENGLYKVNTAGIGSNGTWSRTSDANENGELESGMQVMVTEGTLYGDTEWTLTTDGTIDIGTTALTFERLAKVDSISGHVIQNAGSNLATRTNLNFDGTHLVATDDSGNDQTDVTVSTNLQGWSALTTSQFLRSDQDDSASGSITLTDSANLVFQDNNGTFPTSSGGFFWDLNNDEARIYAEQPASDQIDFFFKISDNVGSTDRFVYWIDDYRGSTYDKYPAQFDGSAQYLGIPVDGSGNKDLANARFKVPYSGDVEIDGNVVWNAGNDGTGSGLDADLLDGVQGSGYAQLSSSPTFTGGALSVNNGSGKAGFGNDGGGSLSLGRTDNVSSTPYIDFNSGSTSVDYDARIQASGGTGSVGEGDIAFTAGKVVFNSNAVARSQLGIVSTPKTVSADVTLEDNTNSMVIDNLTIADGISVTIPDSSTLKVLMIS